MNKICAVSDIPNPGAREFELEGLGVIVVNWHGQIHAWLNDCPHAGWPLNFQPDEFFDLDGRYLQCSNHMALFEPDSGLCVAGPCAGDCLQSVGIQLIDAEVWAELPAGMNPES